MIFKVMEAIQQVLSSIEGLEAIYIGIPEEPLEDKRNVATIHFAESEESKFTTRGSKMNFSISILIASRLSKLLEDYQKHIDLLETCKAKILEDLHNPNSTIRSALQSRGDYTTLSMALVRPPEGKEDIIIHEIRLGLYYIA